ncbi:uncharacterized protein I206_103589 [Kwoniella pini CBS 10737]|uniref:Uncharacterized protein n=1 Tax=Kwoniella pini CBS 10737 TaxID=1296096 RepID=A0AAJ8MN63_9TREE
MESNHHQWGFDVSERLNIALSHLFKNIRKRLVESARTFPKGKNSRDTILSISFLGNMQILKRMLCSLRQVNMRTINKMEDQMVLRNLEEWLMNKGKHYYKYRGITVKLAVKEDENAHRDLWVKETIRCDCCGIVYYD